MHYFIITVLPWGISTLLDVSDNDKLTTKVLITRVCWGQTCLPVYQTPVERQGVDNNDKGIQVERPYLISTIQKVY